MRQHPTVDLLLAQANELAARFDDYVRPEHLLIALMRLLADAAADGSRVTPDEASSIAVKLESQLRPGDTPCLGKRPRSDRMHLVLSEAQELAAHESAPEITVDHLLTCLLDEFACDAALSELNDLRSARMGLASEGSVPPVPPPIVIERGATTPADVEGVTTSPTREQAGPWTARDVNRRQLWTRQIERGRLRCLSWAPQGRTVAIGDDAGGLALWTDVGERKWRQQLPSSVTAVVWHHDGRFIQTVSPDRHSRQWDAESGNCCQDRQLADPYAPLALVSLSKLPLVAYDSYDTVVIGKMDQRCEPQRVESPAGQILALAAGHDCVATLYDDATALIIDATTGVSRCRIDLSQSRPRTIALSADGLRLAVTSHSDVRIFDIPTGQCAANMHGHRGEVLGLSWSADSRWLASCGRDGTARVWSSSSGWEVMRLDVRPAAAHTVAFSPDSRQLIALDSGGRIHLWDVSDLHESDATEEAISYVSRQAATVGRRHDLLSNRTTEAASPSAELRLLPECLCRLHRLGLFPPLSLLRDLLRLTAGQHVNGELGRLASHRAIRDLVALSWPSEARVGMAAMVLQFIPSDGWKPPVRVAPEKLVQPLLSALSGAACEPLAPAAPLSVLTESLKSIDANVIKLLSLLGPDAVAQDPGLPMRILAARIDLSPLSHLDHRSLGLKLASTATGQVSGTNSHGNRDGIATHGHVSDLLTTQFALPSRVFNYRFLERSLVYRARQGAEPPQLRPAIVVLDVSPAVFGPIESVTRLAAHIVLRSMLASGVPATLVTGLCADDIVPVDGLAAVMRCWSARSLRLFPADAVLRLARSLSLGLSGGGLEPVIIVMSHEWFGGRERIADSRGVRGLLVRYPQRFPRPPFSALFEKCEFVDFQAVQRLPELLTALLE